MSDRIKTIEDVNLLFNLNKKMGNESSVMHQALSVALSQLKRERELTDEVLEMVEELFETEADFQTEWDKRVKKLVDAIQKSREL